MTELKPVKEGKVREIYDNGDTLIMVATDRISCFDVILNNQVRSIESTYNIPTTAWQVLSEPIQILNLIQIQLLLQLKSH